MTIRSSQLKMTLIRITLLALCTAVFGAVNTPVTAQQASVQFRFVHSISTGEFGFYAPKGLAFSSSANSFVILGSNKSSAGVISLYEVYGGAGTLSEPVDEYLNVAYDGKSEALFTLNQSSAQLSKVRTNQTGLPVQNSDSTRYKTNSLNLKSAKGITFDPITGRMFVLDGDTARVVVVTPSPNNGFDIDRAAADGRIKHSDLALKEADLRGIAFNPVNNHLYIGSPATHQIYETTDAGSIVTVYDTSNLNLKNPSTMLFAPTRDATDDPAAIDLFILDQGMPTTTSGSGSQQKLTTQTLETQDAQIVELSLISPLSLPAGTTLVPTSLEHTIDASNASWNPSAPDTSGVAYWPSQDKLFVVDSEVEEMPNYFMGKNVYLSTRSGTLVSTCSTTSFNNEPTGAAVNPNNNHLFISSDSSTGFVFEINPGNDGVYCTSDDTRTSLSLSFITGMDAEDVAYGQNKLFLAGGVNAEVYQFDLGPNGVLGGGDDGPVTSFDTASLGFSDLEGLGYSVYNGTLLLVANSGSEEYIGETTLAGSLLRAYNLSFLPSAPHSDVEQAPGSINSGLNNFYVASRGVDNNTDPNENDGKIWEIKITGASTSTPTKTPTQTPASTNTFTPTITNTSNPNGTATFTVTNTFTPTYTFTPSATFTPTPPPSSNPLIVSFASNGSVGGVSFADEDILRFTGTTWSMLFDGSDVGVGGVDVFAFYMVDSDTFLMAFDRAVTIAGLVVSPSDIVQFDATSLGFVTAGTFSMYFNGIDVGLDAAAEDIDALDVLVNGQILISTTGNPSVLGVTGAADEDILAFSPITLGDITTGTWAIYFDGSDVGLTDSNEDIDALDITPNGQIYLSSLGLFSVPGVSGDDEDVFVCTPTSLASVTACTYSSALYFDGSTWGLAANDIDALGLESTGPFATATPSNTPLPTNTPTSSPTATQTFTPTATFTPTDTPTATPTPTFGDTPTPTDTYTPTVTFTPTNTSTATFTPTDTFTPTVTNTPNPTFTPSSTFTPSPTPNLSDVIFVDGFESGSLSAWSANSTNNGNLSANSAAALQGSFGMQAVFTSFTNMYVRDDSPNADIQYRARFYFDPNSTSMASGDYLYILQGYATSSNAIVLRVEIKNNGGVYQVRAKILNNSGSWQSTSYVTITDAPHSLEVYWRAASAAGVNDGQLTFWVDGSQQGNLTGIVNDTNRMESVRLGAPYISATTLSGSFYFDAFESRRQTYIGP